MSNCWSEFSFTSILYDECEQRKPCQACAFSMDSCFRDIDVLFLLFYAAAFVLASALFLFDFVVVVPEIY